MQAIGAVISPAARPPVTKLATSSTAADAADQLFRGCVVAGKCFHG